MNVGVGNLVADFLIPCSPARVHDATGGPKMEARGLSFTLAQEPRDFQVWGQISLSNDGVLIVDGNKLYMPPGAPRKDVLRQMHEGHCGYGKTARFLYYWPSMKYDIGAMIDRCEACQQLQSKQNGRTIHRNVSELPNGTDFRRSLPC